MSCLIVLSNLAGTGLLISARTHHISPVPFSACLRIDMTGQLQSLRRAWRPSLLASGTSGVRTSQVQQESSITYLSLESGTWNLGSLALGYQRIHVMWLARKNLLMNPEAILQTQKMRIIWPIWISCAAEDQITQVFANWYHSIVSVVEKYGEYETSGTPYSRTKRDWHG